MLFLFKDRIATQDFLDPDDAMRLQQVRDWIAGQSWFDVSQHRVNPPVGGPMHWSRIVDLPITALILLVRPFMGQEIAELSASAIVPLLLLGGLFTALFVSARRLAGNAVALLAVGLLATTPTILLQFTPLRIDHHGWQIWMAGIALAGMLDARPGRGGIIAGLALAVWLAISTEGLPYAALFGGVFVLMYLIDARDGVRLRGFAGALGGGALLLLVGLRGTSAPFLTQCDALSAVYAWPLLLFAGATLAGHRLAGDATIWRRLAGPLVGGVLAIVALLVISGPCLTAGPFHDLTPLAYTHWYARVMEGRPIWEQSPPFWGVSMAPTIFGLIATLLAARAAPDGSARMRWLLVALLLLGALAMAMMVMRAMMVAHVFALPGSAWLLLRLFRWAQALPHALQRVPVSVGLALLTPVGLSAGTAALAFPMEAPAQGPAKTDCRAPAVLAPLRALPTSVLFAPLDIGPAILIETPHSVIGTGHHRNVIGINAVTHAFLSSPDGARADIVAADGGRGADYLVVCLGMNEMLLYADAAPKGLAATLAKGKVPSWLKQIPTKGPLTFYKVVR